MSAEAVVPSAGAPSAGALSASAAQDGSVRQCPVCTRSFRPRTLTGAWASVSQHLEDRRRQGCGPHAAVHAALYRLGGRGAFGCACCPLVFSSKSAAFEHLASSRDAAHAALHIRDTRLAVPVRQRAAAADGSRSTRLSRRLVNRMNQELYACANQGNRDAVRRLLALGVNPNKTAGTDSITPLMTAAEAGHDGVVTDLIGTGRCNLNASNVYGQTALAFAAQNGRAGCVDCLLAAPGIDVEALCSGYTAAQLARRAGHHAIADRIAAVTRDDQLELLCTALCTGEASGLFDSVSERVDALYALAGGDSMAPARDSRDDDPEGFNAVPLCIVCMSTNVDTALLPCFHASYCETCALTVWEADDVCAVCRQPINGMQKLYF